MENGQSNGALQAIKKDARSDRNGQIEALFGKLVLAAARHERYRKLTVGDLKAALLEPLLADRAAFGALSGDDGDPARSGVALWASVSPEVSAIIAEKAEKASFPVPLERDDWRGGNEVWLLDIIAPGTEVATAVFSAFSEKAPNGFRMHPVAMGMLDPKLIASIAAGVAG